MFEQEPQVKKWTVVIVEVGQWAGTEMKELMFLSALMRGVQGPSATAGADRFEDVGGLGGSGA